MKVSINWLKEYVDIPVSVEELAERITLAGLDVESVQYIGLPGAELPWERDKFFVGEIMEIKPHPNADRLVLAVVDYGAGEYETMVTGAPNLFPYLGVERPGLKVAVALEGARLYDGHAEGKKVMKLKRATIRGVPSRAMVCSEKELGLGEDHTGIIILDPDAPVGTPLADYLGDVILDIDIKGNKGYLLSMIGIAREVAAIIGGEIRRDAPPFRALGGELPTSYPARQDTSFVRIEIPDPDLCPRYSAALVREVGDAPSPFWMQQRLRAAGMRPINLVVDVTNYVMLEMGQPLHAFDYDKLKERTAGDTPTIIVRRAHPGETMTTLDGVERTFDGEMLLITDTAGPIAIAGVMGGLETEITAETRHILLESANFDFISNRRTAKLLRLPSEASLRFGQGLDPEQTTAALARACQLLEELGGGRTEPVFGDLYPRRREPPVIELDPDYVTRLLGVDIPREEMVRILRSLEFTVEAPETLGVSETPRVSPRVFKVTPPSYRLDVSIPADLAEEIVRIYGYDRLPETLLADPLPPQRGNPALAGEEKVRDILVGCGLQEVITYTLVGKDDFTRLLAALEDPATGYDRPDEQGRYPIPCILDPDDCIRLANPLTPEHEIMRTTLMSNMLRTVWANLRYRERVGIFEIGQVYLPREGQTLPDEPRRVGIAWTGSRYPRSWLEAESEMVDFYDLKGVVETLLSRLGITDVSYVPAQHPTFHPGRTAALHLGERAVGLFGEVDPRVREAYDLPEQPVLLLELDLEALLEAANMVPTLRPISRYPAVARDLAVVVDEAIPAAQVYEEIMAAGQPLLQEAVLFDVYRGAPVPPGKKSLAYSLTFQSLSKTLTDKAVDKAQERIVKHLRRQLGAELRG